MKKIILTSILLVFFTISYSQVNMGLRGGLNLSDYTNTDSDKRADFYFGVVLSLKTGDLYTLQPEITYSRQGAKFENTDLKVDYFSVSVVNKLYFNEDFHFMVGPYFDILLEDNYSYEPPQDDYYYYDDFITPVDIGFVVGLGYDVADNFTIDARLKYGFIDVIDYSNNKSANRVYQIGATYKFDLKKSK